MKNKNIWTADEEKILVEIYPNGGASKELQLRLGRSSGAIRDRAQALGINCIGDFRWSKEEEELLKQHYNNVDNDSLLKLFHNKRTLHAIQSKACKHGLTKVNYWTDLENSQIKEFYQTGQWNLGKPKRTMMAIYSQARIIGLEFEPIALQNSQKEWRRKAGQKSFPNVGKVLGCVISHAYNGAKIRGYECPLLDGSIENMEYLNSIANDYCAISGIPITYKKMCRQTDCTASLDRIDSSKGYVKGNTQWVHKDINRMRMQMSMDKFISVCKQISDFNNSKL